MRGIFWTIKNKLVHFKNWIIGNGLGLRIKVAGMPIQKIAVYYGQNRLADDNQVTYGGAVKHQRLNDFFPNTPWGFNILYLTSSVYIQYAKKICHSGKSRGAKFVWNQNGVAYPAWMPSGWEEKNIKMAQFLHLADYVFYQSEYAQLCADKFLGKRSGPSEILYNAVDTKMFFPAAKKNCAKKLTLLVIGSQYQSYRLESAIRALDHIRKDRTNTRMLVAGKVWEDVMVSVKRLIRDLCLEEAIEFLPPFTQNQAAKIFNQGDILFHTKVQDICPGVVIEAMACGVPIVYSSSGGVPELVGEEAGIGVYTETSWEVQTPPEPKLWAEAILKVAENLSDYSLAARQRAVERFDLEPWVERHRQIFSELLGD